MYSVIVDVDTNYELALVLITFVEFRIVLSISMVAISIVCADSIRVNEKRYRNICS